MGPEAARWLAEQDPDDPAVQVVRRALEGDEDARAEVVAAVREQRQQRRRDRAVPPTPETPAERVQGEAGEVATDG